MTKLHDLYDQGGQSPWLDNLRRDWIHDGSLAQMLENGIRGITSNPTIFAHAIEGQEETKRLAEEGAPQGVKITAFVADVSKPDQVQAFRDDVQAHLATIIRECAVPAEHHPNLAEHVAPKTSFSRSQQHLFPIAASAASFHASSLPLLPVPSFSDTP